MTTLAQQFLRKPRDVLKAQPHFFTRLDWADQYTFTDGSAIQIRKLSGRSAFARNGQHLETIDASEVQP